MANYTFTREELNGKNDKELKRMCSTFLGIPGMSKRNKAETIDAIMAKYGSSSKAPTTNPVSVSVEKPENITGVEFNAQSVITNPDAAFGSKTTTTIRVSCGASHANFPVAGRTVKMVGEFLREVLNVDRLSTGMVNSKEVEPDYILKPGDHLEFLKPAGRKG